ncbi:MAG: DUF4136 domain-containing protein [Sphingomonadaceae bacterium]|nr:DUF4136 domain-containing protein [Sphingomonadaceae bacterium]
MKPLFAAIAALGLTSLSACVAPVGPVEVTRFHLPDTSALEQGSIVVEPAVGQQGNSLEFRSFAAAISRELSRIGYSRPAAGNNSSDQVAVLALERDMLRPARGDSPVSVGVGGNAGSYGSGVGIGIGLDLSGPPPEMIETRLSIVIRDRATGQTLWEGRARFSARSRSPLAQTQLGAAKMAEALFQDFPGRSGETILVK